MPAAAPSHSHRILHQAAGLTLSDYRCAAPIEPAGPEEPNATHSIVFVRRGLFQRSHRGETLLADASTILFFGRGQPYRYAHPLPGGDACTVLALSGVLARQAVARHAPRDAERRDGPFRRGSAPSSPRCHALQLELWALLHRKPAALAVEDLVAELAGESLRAAYREQAPAREEGGPAARRRHRELAEAVRLALHARLADPPALGELAGRLGCSPFHLSRTFHRVAGLPLRRYLGRLRARAAAERLAGGERDLTRLALELGYADHAHFANAFRQEWGFAPSRFRARLGGGAGAAGATGLPPPAWP